MKATWRWGKIRLTLTEEEARAVLLAGQRPDNQLLEFLLDQIRARLQDPA